MHLAHQQRNTQNVTKMVLVASSAGVSQKQFEAFDSPVADTTLWADHKRKPYVDMYGEEYFQSVWRRYLTSKRAYRKLLLYTHNFFDGKERTVEST
jgi:hypothetical protein